MVATLILFSSDSIKVLAEGWQGKPWSGKTWEGKPWRGNSWEGNQWEGNPWSGNIWEGNQWEGKPWSGNTTEGESNQGNMREEDSIDIEKKETGSSKTAEDKKVTYQLDESKSEINGDDAASLAADFTPIVGNLKSLVEVFTGKDVITGDKTNRGFALAGVIPGLGNAVKVVKGGTKVVKAIDKANDVAKGTVKSIPSIKSVIKGAQLPNSGKIRYVPPSNWSPSQPLPKTNGGYIDKFGNVWIKGPSRTKGQSFEWDVQLSRTGKNQLGHLSRDGSHLNVSLDGKITHK